MFPNISGYPGHFEYKYFVQILISSEICMVRVYNWQLRNRWIFMFINSLLLFCSHISNKNIQKSILFTKKNFNTLFDGYILILIKHRQIIYHWFTCLLNGNMRKKQFPIIYIYDDICISERSIINSEPA